MMDDKTLAELIKIVEETQQRLDKLELILNKEIFDVPSTLCVHEFQTHCTRMTCMDKECNHRGRDCVICGIDKLDVQDTNSAPNKIPIVDSVTGHQIGVQFDKESGVAENSSIRNSEICNTKELRAEGSNPSSAIDTQGEPKLFIEGISTINLTKEDVGVYLDNHDSVSRLMNLAREDERMKFQKDRQDAPKENIGKCERCGKERKLIGDVGSKANQICRRCAKKIQYLNNKDIQDAPDKTKRLKEHFCREWVNGECNLIDDCDSCQIIDKCLNQDDHAPGKKGNE